MRELASGIDALYLSARPDIPSDFVARLEEGRAWAAELRRLAPCLVGEEYLGITGYGWGKYRFCLEHPMARIDFTESRHPPSVRIQPRAEYLHGHGPVQLLEDLRYLLEPELGPLYFSVSRLDLFADVQGWSLSLDDAHRFLCRADARLTYEVGGTLTGFEFGTRKTKTLCARIYDKTADVEVKGTEWWRDIWGERYVEGEPVYRVEFEIGRQGLVDFGIDTPSHALEATGDLWRHATGEWLTHRCPTMDQTRCRWPLSPPWLGVQQASLHDRAVGLVRIHASRRQASIARLLPGLTGYVASLAALSEVEDIDDAADLVGQYLRTYE
ncbi:MAG: hypothetical protein ACRDYB_08005, partial [Acidimicrobiales bacterium]